MAIGNAVQRADGFIYVYDEKGRQLCAISAGEGLTGYTSTTVNVKRAGFIYSYNEKGKQTGATPAR